MKETSDEQAKKGVPLTWPGTLGSVLGLEHRFKILEAWYKVATICHIWEASWKMRRLCESHASNKLQVTWKRETRLWAFQFSLPNNSCELSSKDWNHRIVRWGVSGLYAVVLGITFRSRLVLFGRWDCLSSDRMFLRPNMGQISRDQWIDDLKGDSFAGYQ